MDRDAEHHKVEGQVQDQRTEGTSVVKSVDFVCAHARIGSRHELCPRYALAHIAASPLALSPLLQPDTQYDV